MPRADVFRKKSISYILQEGAQQEAGQAAEAGKGGLHLRRTLTVRDLTSLGIAAIIGAGIFSTIGNAAFSGGPAVSLLFIGTAVACSFSALCYAEFASAIPIAGSAYTYAYASFGELIAWLIGWSLVLEYAVSNMAVAISWGGYFTTMMSGFGVNIPEWMRTDYLSAFHNFTDVSALNAAGKGAEATLSQLEGYHAWLNAPLIGSFHFIVPIPAVLIVAGITWLVFRGIKESKNATNVMVIIKLAIVLLVIAVGAAFVNPTHWVPFAPNGFTGVMGGVSAVFFAYIGFDALSTTAEECNNPRKDLPRAMMYSLLICTLLYVAISLVLTGMVSYKELKVADPLAFVFLRVGLSPLAQRLIVGVISVSAVVAMASALLVYQIGQPRIWMSMSRDGLLPPIFGKIHPRFRTPSFSTILTGFVVAVPCLFFNLSEVTDLTSIGTLFAFVLVCGGVLRMKRPPPEPGSRAFRVPYVNGRYLIPLLLLATGALALYFKPDAVTQLFVFSDSTKALWVQVGERLPLYLFLILSLAIAVDTFRRQHSLIPVLGVLSCLYLMTELSVVNWIRFVVWLAIGVAIYLSYSYRHSKLNALNQAT